MKVMSLALSSVIFILSLFSNAYAVDVKLDNMNLKISGTAQILFTKSEIDCIDKQFDFHRMRFMVKGDINKNVKFFSEIEMSSNISPEQIEPPDAAWMATPNNRLNIPYKASLTEKIAAGGRYAQKDVGTDSRLVQGYIDLKYHKKVTLRVGQMPRASSFELNTPVSQLETIQYSTNVGQFGKFVRGFQIKTAPFKFLRVGIGIDDNNGGITGSLDSSDSKLSPGIKIALLPWKKHIQIKLCGRRLSETTSGPDANCAIGGVNFKYSGFHFMGEIYSVHLNPLATTDKKGLNLKKGDITSWFLHASYMIPVINLQLVARYNYFEKRIKFKKTEQFALHYDMEVLTCGFNWNFAKNTRLQVMYDSVNGSYNDSLDVLLQASF